MKYYWPLVLIGATLMIIGPVLPWFRTYYGYVTLGEPTSRYITGFSSQDSSQLWEVSSCSYSH